MKVNEREEQLAIDLVRTRELLRRLLVTIETVRRRVKRGELTAALLPPHVRIHFEQELRGLEAYRGTATERPTPDTKTGPTGWRAFWERIWR